MLRQIVILGGGGHARVLVSTLRRLQAAGSGEFSPKGYTAPNADPDWPFPEIRHLGGDNTLADLDRTAIRLVNGVGSHRGTSSRTRLFAQAKTLGFSFASVLDPSALIDESVALGEGVQVLARAVLQYGCTVGDNVIINTGAIVDHDCRIGSNCHIAPGAVLSGSVSIGDGTHIGTGATIIQGVRIGRSVTVGAGAVVVDDLPDGVVAFGVPARPRS